MKISSIIFFLTFLSSCSVVQHRPASLPIYKPDLLPEKIEERKDTVLPKKTGTPVALVKCDSCDVPFTGILIDSYLLSKYKLIAIERDTLRTMVLAERQSRSEVQAYYNQVLQEALSRAQRTWFEENRGVIGVVVGVVATSALAIGLSYGINQN